MSTVLDGVRVVSMATNLPGPIAAARLTELGASVTKIEPPAGDPLALASPLWYAELTSGQRILVLDLKEPEDRLRLDAELAGADLLITAMRPSALARLGLANAAESYAGLSHVEIVGYDSDREEVVGHDLNYQAAHGTLQPPALPTAPIADLLGAERVVSAALLLLLARQHPAYPGTSAWFSTRRHGMPVPPSGTASPVPARFSAVDCPNMGSTNAPTAM